MTLIINCPGCQRKLQVPENFLGQDVKCPTCGHQFIASAGGSAPASPNPPPISPSRLPDSTTGSSSPAAEPYRYRDDDIPTYRRDTYPEDDDFDDDFDDGPEYRRRRRRYRRRDLEPHRGGLVLTLGIVGLVLGVVGLAFCPLVTSTIGVVMGIIAWVMGGRDLRAIKEGTMDPDGQGLTQGGWICGIISTILNLIFLISCALMLFGFFALAALSPENRRRRLELKPGWEQNYCRFALVQKIAPLEGSCQHALFCRMPSKQQKDFHPITGAADKATCRQAGTNMEVLCCVTQHSTRIASATSYGPWRCVHTTRSHPATLG